MRRPSPLGPLLVVFFVASCTSPSTERTYSEPADGKADDLSCGHAGLDEHGICRRENGQFAPTACCEATSECFVFEDQAFDVCLPDGDGPVDWRSCFGVLEFTEEQASSCCSKDDFLWCDFLPLEPAKAPSVGRCFDVEDQAFDVCLPDDHEPVDWSTCFPAIASSRSEADACCALASLDFMWCKKPDPSPEVICSFSIASPLGSSSSDLGSWVTTSQSVPLDDLEDLSPLEAEQIFRAARFQDEDFDEDFDVVFELADGGRFELLQLAIATDTSVVHADWVRFSMGDTEVGLVFSDDSTLPVTEVSDGDLIGCL